MGATFEQITGIYKRQRLSWLLNLLLDCLIALSFLLVISKVCLWFGLPCKIGFYVFALIIVLALAFRFYRQSAPTLIDVVKFIDVKFSTKDRALALADLLGDSSGEPTQEVASLISKQLAAVMNQADLAEMLRLRVDSWRLALLIGLILLYFALLMNIDARFGSGGQTFSTEIAEIEEILAKPEQLSPQLTEALNNLKSELESLDASHSTEFAKAALVTAEAALQDLSEKKETDKLKESKKPDEEKPEPAPSPEPPQQQQEAEKADDASNKDKGNQQGGSQKSKESDPEAKTQGGNQGSGEGESGAGGQSQGGSDGQQEGDKKEGQGEGQSGTGQQSGSKESSKNGEGKGGGASGEQGDSQDSKGSEGQSGEGQKAGEAGQSGEEQSGSSNKAGAEAAEIKKTLENVKDKLAAQDSKTGEAGESGKGSSGQTKPQGEKGADSSNKTGSESDQSSPSEQSSKSNNKKDQASGAKEAEQGKTATEAGQSSERQSTLTESDEVKRFLDDGEEGSGELANKKFKEQQIGTAEGDINPEFTGSEQELQANPDEAKLKTQYEAVELAKPKPRSGKQIQQIPLEYRELFE